MKPHLRIRKTVKWAGAAATVLLVAMWIGCVFRPVYAMGPGRTELAAGRGVVWARDLVTDIQWNASLLPRMEWGFSWYTGPVGWMVQMPLWFPVVISSAVCAAAVYLDTRAHRGDRLNLCAKCHYDRAGLAAGAACPECGSGAARPASSPT